MRQLSASRMMTLFAGVVFLLFAATAATAQSARPAPDPARLLSQQVWALQTLHDLDLSASQLQSLRAAAPKLEDEPPARAMGRAPTRYLAALTALRQALLTDKDGADDKEPIDDLRDDVASMQEDERIDLDDRVRIDDAARAAVPAVMKSLLPSQLAGYLAAYQDEIPDPVQMLMHAADDARGMDEGRFNELLEVTAKDAGFLAAGLDKDKAAAISARVKQWLTEHRAQSDADFKAARPQLEQSAKTVLGDPDSFGVLRHWIERDVAELLSNPQLGAVIDERIKHLAK